MEHNWNDVSPENRKEEFVNLIRAVIFNGEVEECVAALHSTSSSDFDELYSACEEHETEFDES